MRRLYLGVHFGLPIGAASKQRKKAGPARFFSCAHLSLPNRPAWRKSGQDLRPTAQQDEDGRANSAKISGGTRWPRENPQKDVPRRKVLWAEAPAALKAAPDLVAQADPDLAAQAAPAWPDLAANLRPRDPKKGRR